MSSAAASASQIAAQSEAFTENYFNTVMKPAVLAQTAQAAASSAKLDTMADLNISQMQQAADRYKQYGIPAEEAYYKQVQDYSAPAEQQRQALAAKGDIETAFSGQDAQATRAVGALGGGPLDVGRMAAMRTQQLPQRALIEANAMTRARNAAQQLGMQYTADAANFGRGGQSGILAFGQGAQGNMQTQSGINTQAAGVAGNAGGFVQNGYNSAMQGYQNVANLYGNQANSFRTAEAASSPWNAVGQLAGVGLQAAMGPGGFARSDIRLKHNVVHAWKDAAGVDFYYFDYIGHPGRWLGVIAQELQKIVPDLVHKVGDYLAVKAPYLPRRIG
jgi:Chaperone of endosialidase